MLGQFENSVLQTGPATAWPCPTRDGLSAAFRLSCACPAVSVRALRASFDFVSGSLRVLFLLFVLFVFPSCLVCAVFVCVCPHGCVLSACVSTVRAWHLSPVVSVGDEVNVVT